ncbi:hypothetical protein Ahy_B04g071164 isoform B [Arachis hypogaea]|uniref:Protein DETOXIFICATION n=1 Tax=Arachis hypogaea TaxID=3818 RepID=A0A444ZK59_ARAHY|nr:hypothetical protein Ahy_B04g071164 isoform B [Arachis hypogaea]
MEIASLEFSGAGNVLNAILDPILIFFFGLGISGAAAATVISEYVNNVTLLASSYSQGNYEQARLITYRIGLGTGITLSVILFFGFGSFSSLFTTDLEVLGVARSGILFLAGTQPVNALAFVIDGLYHGVSDYGYAAYSTMLVGLVSSMFLLVAAPELGLPGVWAGLFLFMTMRVLAGTWR